MLPDYSTQANLIFTIVICGSSIAALEVQGQAMSYKMRSQKTLKGTVQSHYLQKWNIIFRTMFL